MASRKKRRRAKDTSLHFILLDKNDADASFEAIRRMMAEVDPEASAKLEAGLKREGHAPLAASKSKRKRRSRG